MEIKNVFEPASEAGIQRSMRSFISTPRFRLNNLYVFGWESDLLFLTKAGYWYEIEIKISRADFKNDFAHKPEKHALLSDGSRTKKPNYFYYAVPKGLITVDEVPPYAGLIHVDGAVHRIVKPAPKLHVVKNDPNRMGLADKFYYNMVLAKNETRRWVEENERLRQPYSRGVQSGRRQMKQVAAMSFSMICPHRQAGENEIDRCSVTGRTIRGSCSGRMCDYLSRFEDAMEETEMRMYHK